MEATNYSSCVVQVKVHALFFIVMKKIQAFKFFVTYFHIQQAYTKSGIDKGEEC